MFPWLALVAVFALVPEAASAQEVSPRARQAIERGERVPLVVVLEAPPLPTARAAGEARRRRIAMLRESVLRSVPAGEIEIVRRYETVAGFTAIVSPAGLDRLLASPAVKRIDVATRGGGALAESVPQIRADRGRARGWTGAGSVIAVLDTGVDAGHPDLGNALVAEECFCLDDCCPGGGTRASGPGSAASRHPHGPNVAGIALSRGVVAPTGVAPGARLVAVRVLDDGNRGYLADWIAGLDWIAADRPDVRVVNMSLASDLTLESECGGDCLADPLCAENALFAELIGLLRARGTLVFAAAGNDGRAAAVSSPACVPGVVAVGAVTKRDRVARLSNGGALLALFAPGIGIISDGPGGTTSVLSGTSMATPHAAGVAALLVSARPGASAEAVERLLTGTGVPIVDTRSGTTVPRVDALSALNAAAAGSELARGGGSRRTDCLVESNFIPPDVVRGGRRSLVSCRDGDPLCDGDSVDGQCTFLLSLCFNVPDPMLGGCDPEETLLTFALDSPRAAAAAGSIERRNAESLRAALPSFPVEESSVCSPPFPLVVRVDEGGNAALRMAVETATRRDYDHFSLRCEGP